MTAQSMSDPPTSPSPAAQTPAREKTGIPRNPGRRDLGMKATLLFPDREIVEKFYVPLIYTACRTCYSEMEPEEIFRKAVAGDFEAAKQERLIKGVIESGHGSTIEHIVFTFGISGVSRTLSHQLVRHRAGVAFDQQSQRYVKFKGASTMMPATLEDADPLLRARYEEQIDGSLELYGDLVEAGIPGEDARFVFPNATRTNLVMTANLRALIHMSGLRLCTMAQWEIRRLFQLIRHEIFQVSPFLGSLPRPEVRPARLLRRDGQPRRALPDTAAQGHRPRRLGGAVEGRQGRPGAARPLSAGTRRRRRAICDQPRSPGAETRRQSARSPTNRRMTRASRGPASAPAARTSSCDRGSPL